MMFRHFVIVFWSIRYLKPSMVYWRIHRTIKGALVRVAERIGVARLIFARRLEHVSVTPIPELSSRYYCERIDLHAREFSFLRDPLRLPSDPAHIRAAVAGKPLLWRFHFAYHDYLLALLPGTSNDDTLFTRILEFVSEWDDVFPLHERGARDAAWHPYVLSIRIESWIRLYSAAIARGLTPESDVPMRLATGVEQMTRVLLRNLERGTMANHLLRNVKALFMAGLFLDNVSGAKARRIASVLLRRELQEQVLDDGCHFERSPMYHVSVLNDALDMVESCTLSGSTVSETLASAVTRMTVFLENMRHPDGEIPLFNDSTFGFFLCTEHVLERALALCAEHQWPLDAPVLTRDDTPISRRSGLHKLCSGGFCIVFDAGLVGPEYQPGHAHCDTLSFELSVDGKRMITDTGVYHYRESPERWYSRCTAAHNTVQIDGEEQSEIWKSFRVGRRAAVLFSLAEELDGMSILRGAHDGYTRLSNGMIHERALVITQNSLCVLDWLHGSGEHTWKSHVHLHPDAVVEEAGDGAMLFRLQDSRLYFTTLENEIARETTEYYPSFGVKHARTTLVMGGRSTFQKLTGFVLSSNRDAPHVRIDETMKHFEIDGTVCVASLIESRSSFVSRA